MPATFSPFWLTAQWGSPFSVLHRHQLRFSTPQKTAKIVMRTWLDTIAREVDANFLNSQVTIEKGEPIIHKPKKKRTPAGLKDLEALLAQRLNPISLLDILSDTQCWLDWCQDFGPISGLETKLADATLRYLITVFAYGTQLGH